MSDSARKHPLLLCGSLLVLLVMSQFACAPAAPAIAEQVTTVLPEPGNTATVAAAVTSTIAPPSPIGTLAPSATPTRYVVTPRPSYTPEPTSVLTISPLEMWRSSITSIPSLEPLPTIPPEMREVRYLDLMATNGGCELPCWWGFELGRSNLADVRQLYEQFAPIIAGRTVSGSGFQEIDVTLSDIGPVYSIRHVFGAVDGALVSIVIDAAQSQSYQIELIMQKLGPAEEIWLWTQPEANINQLHDMALIFYYPDVGMIVRYELEAEKVAANVIACFDRVGTIQLSIWSPEIKNPGGDKDLEAMLNGGYEYFYITGMHPIQEVSNWDVEQFYTTLVDPSHVDCLETPADIWPLEGTG